MSQESCFALIRVVLRDQATESLEIRRLALALRVLHPSQLVHRLMHDCLHGLALLNEFKVHFRVFGILCGLHPFILHGRLEKIAEIGAHIEKRPLFEGASSLGLLTLLHLCSLVQFFDLDGAYFVGVASRQR